jgi:hypothetical protein
MYFSSLDIPPAVEKSPPVISFDFQYGVDE